jgi:hypothetical protein
MNLYIYGLKMLSTLEYGALFKTSYDGGSVASAREANVSIIKLTQSISIVFKGDFSRTIAPTTAIVRATIFTVS